MRMLSLLAIITQIAFGNLCMMNIAYAEDISTSMAHDHGSMEMVMSPVIPMSPLHCTSCLAVVIKQAPPFTIPCDNGHCVSHAIETVLIGIPAMNPLLSIALPMPQRTFVTLHHSRNAHMAVHPPPYSQLSTTTVVLLN